MRKGIGTETVSCEREVSGVFTLNDNATNQQMPYRPNDGPVILDGFGVWQPMFNSVVDFLLIAYCLLLHL